jgi:uncharacterized protein YigE (DUF2233 family)
MIRPSLFALLTALSLAPRPVAAQATPKPCEARVLQEKKVIVCTFDAARHSFRTLWKDKAGTPYGSLSGIASAPTGEAKPLLMAMNAGMYHHDLDPVGLYIENGATLKKASTAGGPGNFHMRPNGVFHVAGGTVGVTETRRFVAGNTKPDFASQSGPMLVIDGKLHPAFTGRGQSEKIRNGVGVAAGGKVYFVISEEPVTFTAFGRMFRDDLKTRNALYFDGSISSLYAPSVNRADRFMPVGPIVAVYPR